MELRASGPAHARAAHRDDDIDDHRDHHHEGARGRVGGRLAVHPGPDAAAGATARGGPRAVGALCGDDGRGLPGVELLHGPGDAVLRKTRLLGRLLGGLPLLGGRHVVVRVVGAAHTGKPDRHNDGTGACRRDDRESAVVAFCAVRSHDHGHVHDHTGALHHDAEGRLHVLAVLPGSGHAVLREGSVLGSLPARLHPRCRPKGPRGPADAVVLRTIGSSHARDADDHDDHLAARASVPGVGRRRRRHGARDGGCRLHHVFDHPQGRLPAHAVLRRPRHAVLREERVLGCL
mmetsp:Transcript_172916/g.554460  ORF Transcript_172916/g.554460 Transcript_172916/m.554460 type:complete len:290 (-) Transcript_172916:620-1489(-)